MTVLEEKVLVLNKSWRPIRVTTVRDAFVLVYQDVAQIVDPRSYATFDFESWRGAAEFAREHVRLLRAYNWQMPIPEIIVLRDYNGMDRRQVKFCRRNVFERDQYSCQYCGRRLRTQELTLDHVLPRSRGGKTTWLNVVVACHGCNGRKANRTPLEARMTMIRQPRRPHWEEVRVRYPMGGIPASWEAFMSELYWGQELEA
ncbi:MAG: HNH endonuclease [Planctomycetota bacterium]